MAKDLSLIPMNDLIEEIESRCETFILAYESPKEKDKELQTWYGKGIWKDSVSLASILNNEVLNNYSGELRTLREIHNES